MKARLKRAYIAGSLAFAISWSVASATPAYDFCAMMIPHHQGAVDMAKAVLYSIVQQNRNEKKSRLI